MPGVRGGPHRQRHSPRGVQAVPGGYSRSRKRGAAVPVWGVDCAPVKKRGVLRKVLDQAKRRKDWKEQRPAEIAPRPVAQAWPGLRGLGGEWEKGPTTVQGWATLDGGRV